MEVGSPANTTADLPANSTRRRRPRNRNRQTNGSQEPSRQQMEHTPHVHRATQSSQQDSSQQGHHGGRGRGRGHGRERLQVRTPGADELQSANTAHDQGRRQRGGPRFGRGLPARNTGGRHFGGQLTVDEDHDAQATAAPSTLQADAPHFAPGKPVEPRPPKAPRKPKAPKSSAPDITTRTHEDIDNGHYECAICTEEVRRTSRGVWSCRTCWTVFHIGCIKKWSANEGSTAARQQAPDGELPPPRQWRCPGCNLPKDGMPKSASCWCEKEMDPRSLPGLPPFSCGQTCSRSRVLPKKCPHPCSTTCHAGPCPPCSQMGPTQHCFCGKKYLTRRCVDTNYESGWSCETTCNQIMPCGKHYCTRPCHEGTCGDCTVRVSAKCYCGHEDMEILCRDQSVELISTSQQAPEKEDKTISWTGSFECDNICGRQFECGIHVCEKTCHQQEANQSLCPFRPERITHCPCGKTSLADIPGATRSSCQDPIANCSKACDKTLDCGHTCQQACHFGNCLPCLRTVTVDCRCGRTTSDTICHQGCEEPPQCMRICRVTLNCGRHECGDRCCSGERKASERQSHKKKQRPLGSARQQPDDSFEAEHICTRACDRQLRCGNPQHRCQELCHKGACGTCRDAIFDELSCDCGRTVLQPPLPCGTRPPPCRFQCERPKACGHPQTAHNCHQNDESCPKCPFLTTKPCLCGKHTLKNQPCWFTEVRCGDACGRQLKCGSHRCQKQCHRPGDCEEPCRQTCGKELSTCGHPCMSVCHAPTPCKEERPCQHKIFITCECQRIKQEARCSASRSGDGNNNKMLKCDDECARLERNRRLALALNVDPEHQTDHIPYSADTLNMYQVNSTWAAAQEKELRLFAAREEEKRYRFKPMAAQQRAFLHSLAEDFQFDSESMDPAPHRHVAIFKTPRFVMAPMKTLAECIRIRQVQRVVTSATTAPPLASRTKPSAVPIDPFNGFLITDCRFALTSEEVKACLKSVLPKTSFPLELNVSFLPSEDVALKPPIAARVTLPESEIQNMLESIKPTLAPALQSQKIGRLQLVRLDASLNVLRRETDLDSAGAGWSTVAAKGAPARHALQSNPIGTRGGFAVLSLAKSKKKKAKQPPVEVVEDWEAAETLEEQNEMSGDADEGTHVGLDSEAEGADTITEAAPADHAAVWAAVEAPSEVVDDKGADID